MYNVSIQTLLLKNCWAWLFVGCGKKCSITIPVPFLVYNMNHLALEILRGKLGRETITTIISVYCLPITSSILYKYFVLGFPISFIVSILLDNTFLIPTRLLLFDIKERKTICIKYIPCKTKISNILLVRDNSTDFWIIWKGVQMYFMNQFLLKLIWNFG